MQSGVSVREGTILWSEHSAGDAELDWISLIHSVTHNLSIRTDRRTPLHSHLERQTTKSIKLLNKNLRIVQRQTSTFSYVLIQLVLIQYRLNR